MKLYILTISLRNHSWEFDGKFRNEKKKTLIWAFIFSIWDNRYIFCCYHFQSTNTQWKIGSKEEVERKYTDVTVQFRIFWFKKGLWRITIWSFKKQSKKEVATVSTRQQKWLVSGVFWKPPFFLCFASWWQDKPLPVRNPLVFSTFFSNPTFQVHQYMFPEWTLEI